MAETQSSKIILNPKNGYCVQTMVYHSLRPAVALPPLSQPLSIFQYALSLLHCPATATSSALGTTTFMIDAATGRRLTYSAFLRQVASLSSSLKPSLSKNDVAFVLSPPSLHIPVLYFSLLSLGVVVSPSSSLSSPSELIHQIQISKPVIAFATLETCRKLPQSIPTILLDSQQFLSMLELEVPHYANNVAVNQSDAATILYSSGTTGRAKGVMLTHRNWIARIAGLYHVMLADYRKTENGDIDKSRPLSLFSLPMCNSFGFFSLIMGVAMGESSVLMRKHDLVKMLEVVEKYGVTHIPVAPPVVVAMVQSKLVSDYDLSSMQKLVSGGAPLGTEVAERFREKFPHVEISQGYGLTEGGPVTRAVGSEESRRYGSVGRLSENFKARIVHPQTGHSLPPGQRGELWLRGPPIMKGYAGDEAATAAVFDSEGWLKTGDLCYFDEDGFLFVVDRLKELIKYKAYQVPPVELEHLLQGILEIADAAVIPYPDEEAGQIPMAYIVRKPGSAISATQIMDFIAKQVAPYKKIRRVAFINSIPKSPAGKILRRELIDHALSKM